MSNRLTPLGLASSSLPVLCPQALSIRLRLRDPLPPTTTQQQSSFYSSPSQPPQQDSSPASSLVEELDHGRPTNLAEFEFMLRAGESNDTLALDVG